MGVLHNRKSQEPRRKALRNAATRAEHTLWQKLKSSRLYGRKFRRQHGVGPYIVDFYCPTERLVIELDGASHDDPALADYDTRRQRHLEVLGLRVLRFGNREVFETPDLVLAAIASCFQEGASRADDNEQDARP